MNIFEKIKQIFTRKKQKQLNSGIYKYNSIDRNNKIELYDLKQLETITHEDGTINNLMIAKIMKYNENQARLLEDIRTNYKTVAFEIPAYHPYTEPMIAEVAKQYDSYYSNTGEFCTYMGELNLTNKGFQFTHLDSQMLQYIKQNIEPQLKQELENEKIKIYQEMENQRSTSENEHNNFVENLREETLKYQKHQRAINSKRLRNPYLAKTFSSQNNNKEISSDWEGINLENGEILRIMDLRKIGKGQTSNQYLYTATINSSQNEADEILINQKTGEYEGNKVWFELPTRIETYMQDGQIYQNDNLQKILTILSNGARPKQDRNYSYIGSITQEGYISYNENEVSPEIIEAVERIREEYGQKLEIQRQEEQGDGEVQE